MSEDAVNLAAPTVVPEGPKSPVRVSQEDRLRIENASLRVINCQLQEERCMGELVKIQEATAKMQKELLTLRDELSAKYNTDFRKYSVKPDGTIVEAPTGAPRG